MAITLEWMMVGEAQTFYSQRDRWGSSGDIDVEWLEGFTAAKVREKELLGDKKSAGRLNAEREAMLKNPEKTLQRLKDQVAA